MGRQALALAHGNGIIAIVLCDYDAVGIMNDSVANSVGKGWVQPLGIRSLNG